MSRLKALKQVKTNPGLHVLLLHQIDSLKTQQHSDRAKEY